MRHLRDFGVQLTQMDNDPNRNEDMYDFTREFSGRMHDWAVEDDTKRKRDNRPIDAATLVFTTYTMLGTQASTIQKQQEEGDDFQQSMTGDQSDIFYTVISYLNLYYAFWFLTSISTGSPCVPYIGPPAHDRFCLLLACSTDGT